MIPLLAYAIGQWEGYVPAAHHRLIAGALTRVATGECKRLMIFMPPRHGKSMLASEFFPAWYLGLNPSHQVIAATYAQELANDFGRKVRNLCRAPQHAGLFRGFNLAEDSQAACRFHTPQKGVYQGVGVGGAATGRGAHLLLIDDPLKGREEAESETIRRRLKEWYSSVAYTRLMPGGAVVVIQCMTGDTPVLMADGNEKPLRDVRPGDHVATYHEGKIKSSYVCNWASQGFDFVYRIKTTCGKVVKANERHPFLVLRDGGLSWVRVQNLRVGDAIVRAAGSAVVGMAAANATTQAVTDLPMQEGDATGTTKVKSARTPSASTGNGKVSSARSTDVISRHDAMECAMRITRKQSGPAATVPHLQLTHLSYETESSAIGMELAPVNTTPYSPSKEAFALSAGGPMMKGRQSTGTPSLSTTATRLGASGACSATIATSSSGVGATLESCNEPLNTFVLTVARVEEIQPCGHEEVFDLQIEGTENFIANGLVSHNTRWHEDDLAGWLLREHAHEGWEVLSLPAVAEPEDPMGRPEGSALWPESYPVEALERIRAAVGPRDWASLYQQRPAAAEGAIFRREHWRYFDPPADEPRALCQALGCFRVVQAWDTAFKSGESNDFSVGVTLGVAAARYYLLDVWRARVEFPELRQAVVSQHLKWGAHAVLIENAASGQSLIQELQRATRIPLQAIKADRDKVSRAHAVTATHAAGLVYLPQSAHWLADFTDELASFPAAPHDDQVDAFVHALAYAIANVGAAPAPDDEPETYHHTGDDAWMG